MECRVPINSVVTLYAIILVTHAHIYIHSDPIADVLYVKLTSFNSPREYTISKRCLLMSTSLSSAVWWVERRNGPFLSMRIFSIIITAAGN
jgi:hypothetical protein